jgi:hypothetical protein
MKNRTKILVVVFIILAGIGVKDIIHLEKPDKKIKQTIEAYQSFPTSEADTIIVTYNAYNAIYPVAVDFVKKNFFPSTYPCRLCYLAFGNSGPLPEWKSFIESLPYRQLELHKEDFRRKYLPKETALPNIMLSKNGNIQMLLTAEEINSSATLQEIIQKLKRKI